MLWTILDNHRNGRIAEAVAGWERISLTSEMEVWREIALGAGYLRFGDYQKADLHLRAASYIKLDHAVVSYCIGVLRLEQARSALSVPDRINENNLVLVAAVTSQDFRAGQAYKAMAMAEFRSAIARANEIRLDEPLLTTNDQIEQEVDIPNIGELLAAIGGDNFVGKSHHALFALELDRGMLAEAELHLDQAVATGLASVYGYEDLARAYLHRNQNKDALRVAQKHLQDNLPGLWKAFQEISKRLVR